MPEETTPSKKTHRAHHMQPIEAAKDPEALLTMATVSALTGYAPDTIRRKVARGQFPAPLRFSKRDVKWKARVIRAYLAEREAAAAVMPL